MVKRKLIGVIISEVEGLYQNKLLKGIISQCYALNYDVAVFSTFIKDCNISEYKTGEKNIYNLINFDLFDGILVAPISFAIDHLFEDIQDKLKKYCRCPVLYIDVESRYFPSIYTNDRSSVEKLTDHLIDSHKLTDIICLAGPPSPSTNYRVAGFKSSFVKHNFPVDENRIYYEADFWYTAGEKFSRKIINKEIPLPEAIVCITDFMAIGLAKELGKAGIKVPEDVIITGFDATEDAATFECSITSFSPPIYQAGIEAVCELSRRISGRKPERCSYEEGKLELGHSCGCNDTDFVRRIGLQNLKDKSNDYKAILDSYMSEALTGSANFDDCIINLSRFLYLIKNYSDYYLCLCDNWDGSADNYSDEHTRYLTEGYTNQMNLVLACEERQLVKSNTVFFTKFMIPDLWKERSTPKAYYFTPVHFNERCIGYSVLTYGNRADAFDITYRNWSRNIMNALEFLRVQKKLYLSSFRDVLTGIYNRNGLDQNISRIFRDAIHKHKKLLVLMSDVDSLKATNDQFGHKEGDNSISVVANAIQRCCRGNEICARIGGDEILVVGSNDYSDNTIIEYMSNVNKCIANYNASSEKPYRIEVSMGAFCDYINNTANINDLIDYADKLMYQNKTARKRNRRL